MADDVLFCRDLDRAIALMTQLGLRLDTIFPADDPRVAVMSGQGAQVRLVRSDAVSADAAAVPEPIDLASFPPRPPTTLVVRSVDDAWTVGRAGMRYRDLIPYRAGGRYIGSHIVILEGGPVPDYVHHHAVQFHLVYCYRGWVRVVYEDQGEPFAMQAGDCVLQPPGIRHRVLEASPGLEVIEVAAPAVHATHVEHELALPTAELRRDRIYGGQRFVRFTAATARYSPSEFPGFDACELGIAAATRGFGSARVLRARDPSRFTAQHTADLLFHFVLRGRLALDDETRLGPAAAFTLPAGQPFAWSEMSPDLELLQVALPGELGVELL